MFNQKEYDRQYQKEHPEACREATERWRKNHPKKYKESQRRWRKNNPEKIKEYEKRRHEKKRQYIDDYKLSRGCSICGYNKYASALDFHHNGDKEFNIRDAGSVSLKRLKEEIKKCIILCANCHRELHQKKKDKP